VITGAHVLIYTPVADEVRAFLADVLDLPSVEAGGGWPIFALPPSELAVHPTGGGPTTTELYLMCDDIEATLDALRAKGATVVAPVTDQGWGLRTALRLPGGAELGLYEPRHPTAHG
jgi:catechol 2,3-dioxygenase-like lactoylglutathione lyase family enzyme